MRLYLPFNIGAESYNLHLSQRRAERVKQYLVEKGVKVDRLRVKGYGEDRPVASNETGEGRNMNRRVEVKDRHKLPLPMIDKKL